MVIDYKKKYLKYKNKYIKGKKLRGGASDVSIPGIPSSSAFTHLNPRQTFVAIGRDLVKAGRSMDVLALIDQNFPMSEKDDFRAYLEWGISTLHSAMVPPELQEQWRADKIKKYNEALLQKQFAQELAATERKANKLAPLTRDPTMNPWIAVETFTYAFILNQKDFLNLIASEFTSYQEGLEYPWNIPELGFRPDYDGTVTVTFADGAQNLNYKTLLAGILLYQIIKWISPSSEDASYIINYIKQFLNHHTGLDLSEVFEIAVVIIYIIKKFLHTYTAEARKSVLAKEFTFRVRVIIYGIIISAANFTLSTVNGPSSTLGDDALYEKYSEILSDSETQFKISKEDVPTYGTFLTFYQKIASGNEALVWLISPLSKGAQFIIDRNTREAKAAVDDALTDDQEEAVKNIIEEEEEKLWVDVSNKIEKIDDVHKQNITKLREQLNQLRADYSRLYSFLDQFDWSKPATRVVK